MSGVTSVVTSDDKHLVPTSPGPVTVCVSLSRASSPHTVLLLFIILVEQAPGAAIQTLSSLQELHWSAIQAVSNNDG